MKTRWWLVAVLALGPAAPAWADVAPHFGKRYRPTPSTPVHPANAVPVVIEASDTLTEPRLVVPRPLLARAKKLPAVRPTAALQERPWRAGGATVLVGLALTAALSAGGLCLARRRGRALVVVLLVGTVCAVGAGRAFVRAHPQPPSPPPPAEVVFDRAAVEVVERGTEVRLLVPRARLGELARNLR
jgi:hypothetical protein